MLMLDGFIAVISQLHEPIFDAKYSASQAITKVTLYQNHASRKLTVVFLPWHVPDWYAARLQAHLATLPSSVLTYHFNPNIITADVLTVKNSFEFAALSIASDVAALVKAKGYRSVDLLGISLGNVALCITAEKLAKFNKVIMLVPGSTLAGSLWSGWRTRRLRSVYKKLGLGLLELEHEWDIAAPSNHLEVLKNHDLHIVLAHRDRFIPYRYGRKLVRDLLAAHARVTFTEKPFGHIITMLAYDPARL